MQKGAELQFIEDDERKAISYFGNSALLKASRKWFDMQRRGLKLLKILLINRRGCNYATI